MPHLNLALEAVPRRSAVRTDQATAAAADWVLLPLAVASTDVFMIRQALQRAIGHLARIYVVKLDRRHGETTVQVEVARHDQDQAMDAIMHALPAAEFGCSTPLDADHVAH